MTGEEGRAELAAWAGALGVSLTPAQWAALAGYLNDLQAESETVNLTAEEPALWWRRHIADGLAAVWALRPRLPAEPRVLDLGAGAGFVGVAWKVAWPGADVTLMESSYRKFRFLNWAAARLGLRGLRVELRRAGDPGRAADFDAVLARAVAPLPDAARLGLPLAKPEGLFAAFQSAAPSPEEPELLRALKALGGELLQTPAYRLPGEEKDRHLALIARHRRVS